MEECAYNIVQNVDKENDMKKWTPLVRQVFVCSGLWIMYFSPGLTLGVPPIYIAQNRKIANSTDTISTDMASWIMSAFGYASIPWVFLIPMISHRFGRKISFYVVSLGAIVSHILVYRSTTVTEYFISETISGVTFAAITTLNMQVIAEYTSPQYRGVLLTLKSAIMHWGVWVGNVVATFSHWRNVGLVGLVCCVYCATSLFWPESPYWLASKRRYRECKEAHYWLKGFGDDSKKELDMIISFFKKEYNEVARTVEHGIIRKTLSVICDEEFYKPLLLSLVIFLLFHCTGKWACNMYVLQIVKEVTASESAAYMTMLVVDGVTVAGMYVGCILSKFFKRRTLLLTCASAGISFLYAISLYLYLIYCKILEENKIVLMLLIAGFSVFITVGPMLLLSTVCVEIIPRRWYYTMSFIVGMTDKLAFSTVLKFSPSLFKAVGLHGTFFCYAASSTVFTLYLHKYLPETKDKPLQEIANSFKTKQTKPSDIKLISEPSLGT